MAADRIRLKIYVIIFIFLLLFGIIGFMSIENLSLMDAVYFSIVTMATVGYGDIHPHTDMGKMLVLVLIVGGVGTFLGVIASITNIFVNRREESLRNQKLNMLTGLFFSEMGNGLLKRLTQLDPDIDALYKILKASHEWTSKEFNKAYKSIRNTNFIIDSRQGDLFELRDYLQNQAHLLLRLIENPIVHEHGNFTDLLRAIFHLRDELLNRAELFELLSSD